MDQGSPVLHACPGLLDRHPAPSPRGYLDFFALREPVNAWSHCAGLLLALPGTLLLWRRSSGDHPAKRLSLLVFGLSLAFCYAASTLYHGLRIPNDRLDAFDRLDRIGIFLLIAGSYTPLAWSLLRGRWRWGTLATVWSITAVASGKLAIGGPFPPLLTTGLYLGMGWGVVVCYAELARVVSHRALRPLVAGGLFYSVGAVLNLLRWPVLWPGLLGGHELFHLFVLGGSLAHYRLMLQVVVPFGHGSGVVSLGPGRGRSFWPGTCRT
jgi:hemolysin III